MAKLDYNVYSDPTLEAMNQAMELEQKLEKERKHLGASVIGNECQRYSFYYFRGTKKRNIGISGIKAIQDGYDQEDKTIERLRKLPFIQLINDDGNGNQIGFESLLGHFCGSVDGVIRGLLQAPETWHVFEHKSKKIEEFNKLKKLIEEKGEKEALYHWDITYYEQAQTYMHFLDLTRHYMVVSSPGGRDHISCRTEYKRAYAERIIEKAQAIIFDNWSIPAKLSENREFYKCKWCDYQSVCHDGEIPDVHCRTCRYRQPVDNGQNQCLLTENIIEDAMLWIGCKHHIFNPALMPGCTLVEHQEDGCIYHIPEKDFYFSNTNIGGFPEIPETEGRLDAIYTSFELKENIKNINNLGKANMKVQKAFAGEIDPSSNQHAKAGDKLSNDHSRLIDL